MQNLPISATPAVTPATPVPAAGNATDTNAAPSSETFGSVLARQRANNSNQMHDSNQASTSSGDTLTDTEATDAQQTATANLLGMLPADMLATLLPTNASSTDTALDGKGSRKTYATAIQEAKDTLLTQSPTDTPGILPSAIPAPVVPLDISSGKQTRSAADALTRVSLASTANRGAIPAQGLTATGIATTVGTATATAQLSQENAAAMDVLKSLNAEKTDALPLAAMVHHDDSALAVPQSDISTGVNIPPQVTAALATQPGAPVQVAVNAPVGQDAWADDFNQSITWLASQHEQSAQLHLNPPNLGPLDVVLNVSDGQATAFFTSPHAAVRDAVEQALPRLREMLADNGITLGNAMVSDQSPRDPQANFTQNQLKGGGVISDKGIGAAEVAVSAVSIPERRHQGMVDTFA